MELLHEVHGEGAQVVVHEPVQPDAHREHQQALRGLDGRDDAKPEFVPVPQMRSSFRALPLRIFCLSSGLTGSPSIHFTPGGLGTNG